MDTAGPGLAEVTSPAGLAVLHAALPCCMLGVGWWSSPTAEQTSVSNTLECLFTHFRVLGAHLCIVLDEVLHLSREVIGGWKPGRVPVLAAGAVAGFRRALSCLLVRVQPS